MDIKAKPFSVSSGNPFDGDLLERRADIENLTLLLSNMGTPMVIAVNGRWGTGKSTFVDMWSAYLRQHHYPVLNFNAWSTDFSEDPLVAFLGEMNAGLQQHIGNQKDQGANWTRCKNIGGRIAQHTLPVAVRIFSSGVLDGKSLADGVAKTEITKFLGGIAEDAVAEYEKTRSDIVNFKELLSKVLEKPTKDKSLVIFVDELDRCRPKYAIELLERIKHLFDLQGVIFVLSMDKEQLCHSIGAVYGNIDAENYLRRFIDLEFTLPTPSPDDYIRKLTTSFGLVEYFAWAGRDYDPAEALDELRGTFALLSRSYNLSLRQIEQLLSRVSLAVLATPDRQFHCSGLIVLLIILREVEPELYSALRNNGARLLEAIELVENLSSDVKDEKLSWYKGLIEGYLRSCYSSKESINNELEKYERALQYDRTLSDQQREYIGIVYKVIDFHSHSSKRISLERLIRQVDLTQQFTFTQSSGGG
tara:strand:- start:109682 stop:111106 length:1425 start_codon:yes stop_codon:yes gene_type:complete